MRILVLFFVFMWASAFSQNNALILNDNVVVSLNENVSLTVNQSNPSGIALTGSGLGYIQSESEGNRVVWRIDNGTGNFVIPFGVDGSKMDMSYNISVAGSAIGALIASTYATVNNNTSYPSLYSPAVTDVFLNGDSVDYSLFAVDRFWVLRKLSWGTKPPTSSVTFTYRDVEYGPANIITESSLLAQYWNGTEWYPSWSSGTPLYGVNNAAANEVNSINAGSGNFYTWILSHPDPFLPVKLYSFDINCLEGASVIEWATASETNNHYFTIERSFNGNDWDFITTVLGAGNSNELKKYSYADSYLFDGIKYYRLSQTDFDGKYEILGIKKSECKSNSYSSNIYAYSDESNFINISFYSENEEYVKINLFDITGRLIYKGEVNSAIGQNNFKIEENLPTTIYIINVSTPIGSKNIKFIYNK